MGLEMSQVIFHPIVMLFAAALISVGLRSGPRIESPSTTHRGMCYFLIFILLFNAFLFFASPYGSKNYLACLAFLLLSSFPLLLSLKLRSSALPTRAAQYGNVLSLKQIARKVVDYSAELRFSKAAVMNAVFVTAFFAWFAKEYTGYLPVAPFNFVINLLVLDLVLLTLFINSRARHCVISRPNIGLDYKFDWKKDYPLIFVIMLFLIPISTVLAWEYPYHYHPGDDEYVIPSMHLSEGNIGAAISNRHSFQNPLYENQQIMYYLLVPLFVALKPFVDLFVVASPLSNELLTTIPDAGSAEYFLMARVINIGLAIGILAGTYLLAGSLFNKRIALSVVLILAGTKILQHNALFMRPDIPLTLIITLLMLSLCRSLKENRRRYLYYGALIGVGMSLKPYALLFSFPVLLLMLYDFLYDRSTRLGDVIGNGSQFLSSMYVFFYAGRFYSHVFNQELGTGLWMAVEHSNLGQNGLYPTASYDSIWDRVDFSLTVVGWWFSPTLILFIVAGLILSYGFFWRHKTLLLIATTTIFCFSIFSIKTYQMGKFYLILAPMAAVLVGSLIQFSVNLVPQKMQPRVWLVLTALIAFPLYAKSYANVAIMHRPDIRTEVAQWFSENTKRGSSVAILGRINWQKPPISSEHNEIVTLDGDLPEYLVLPTTSYNTEMYYLRNPHQYRSTDWYPLKEPAPESLVIPKQLLAHEGHIVIGHTRYELIKRFEKNHNLFFGFSYDEYHEHPGSFDVWAVTNPKPILIYGRAATPSLKFLR